MEILKGKIAFYIFHNEQNNYSVVRLDNDVIAVGNIPELEIGERVELEGDWTEHPKYGMQFKFTDFKIPAPETEKQIVSYLTKAGIPGIGKTTAKKIHNAFGSETISIIESEPDRLSEVSGISGKTLDKIKQGLDNRKGLRHLILFLQEAGVPSNLAGRIYKAYGDEAVSLIRDNPYRLPLDIWGLKFETADKIAAGLSFEMNSPFRIKAAIITILTQASENGHTYLPKEELLRNCANALRMEAAYDDALLDELSAEAAIITEDDRCWLPELYTSEKGSEKIINELLEKKNNTENWQKINLRLDSEELSSEQQRAVESALENNILILTGGPGTGKTTTVKGIITAYKRMGRDIALAAPTGRAAKRMTDLTGRDAKTIHRLLEYNPANDTFFYNLENPLSYDLIIIDETSMIDANLMYNLLSAGRESAFVFVGDTDQLPSVGPGNVLRDLIASQMIPVAELTKIFRQAEESGIITAAHSINSGEVPDIHNNSDSDFSLIIEPEERNIPGKVAELVTGFLPNEYGFDPVNDIQILAPMYKGEAGVNNFNKVLQGALNPNPDLLRKGFVSYREGDKVMQLRNNYDKMVFNGDQGFITRIIRERTEVEINFNARLLIYSYDEMDEITLAYAVTVHKSQGSEFPCVILSLTDRHYPLLQRNLLYTAVTRASERMVIIGSQRALMTAVMNNRVQMRYTSLFK